jgi:hypothetical protein
MKIALITLLFAASAFAQAPPAGLPAACGSGKVSFNVTLDNAHNTPAQPDQGQARVYFIQDNGTWGEDQHNTLRIGMDGAWVGAYKDNSWFFISVQPGEHHVCANVQSHFSVGQLVALAHFTAEAGKAYYFRTRFLGGLIPPELTGGNKSWNHESPPPPYLDLDLVDSDQGEYLVASSPQSVWKSSK